jgi:peroxiredoxin Q/BCP
MRVQAGEALRHFSLPDIAGGLFDTRSLEGRPFLLSFFRYAGCPFCNLRMHELVGASPGLGGRFTIVAVFDSPLDNLVAHAEGHRAPFPVLADAGGVAYDLYGVEHSVARVMKSMVRLPAMLKAARMGYLPTTIQGRLDTLPADFLVDAGGRIAVARYARDAGDRMPLEQIAAFARTT